jgi:hypothetical protein
MWALDCYATTNEPTNYDEVKTERLSFSETNRVTRYALYSFVKKPCILIAKVPFYN